MTGCKFRRGQRRVMRISRAGFPLRLDLAHTPASLEAGSCFPSLMDARAFSRDLRPTFSLHSLEGKPSHGALRALRFEPASDVWCQTPLAVHAAEVGYFASIGQRDCARLEWAVRYRPMRGQWILGEAQALLVRGEVAQRLYGVA